MREIQYQKFSWNTHAKNWKSKSPNVCQFELTFNCGLRCRHCYTDCYNKPALIKKELKTKEVMAVLDKAYQAGVIWVCFTGGDPLTRKDFLEIYTYAKNKGFIVTVFTNAYSMTQEIADYFKKSPPFVIEMTLNAASKDLYEKISQVKGSFKKVMQGIELMLKNKIPLKIKTQITKDNVAELDEIKKLIESWGLEFRPSIDLHARLDGNLTPCNLRLSPKEVFNLNGKKESFEAGCNLKTKGQRPKANNRLFRCAIGGGDGLNVDPYGNTFMCNLIRKPLINLLEVDIKEAQNRLLPMIRAQKFTTDSKCRNCNLIESCRSCPGRAYVETGDIEAPIEYHCQLAKQVVK